MPINANKPAETHIAWHSLALIFSMTRGTEAGYPKVEQNNNKKSKSGRKKKPAQQQNQKNKGWIVQNASFRMKHQHLHNIIKQAKKNVQPTTNPPKGHRWIIKKLHLPVRAETPMHAGRP